MSPLWDSLSCRDAARSLVHSLFKGARGRKQRPRGSQRSAQDQERGRGELFWSLALHQPVLQGEGARGCCTEGAGAVARSPACPGDTLPARAGAMKPCTADVALKFISRLPVTSNALWFAIGLAALFWRSGVSLILV